MQCCDVPSLTSQTHLSAVLVQYVNSSWALCWFHLHHIETLYAAGQFLADMPHLRLKPSGISSGPDKRRGGRTCFHAGIPDAPLAQA